MITIAIPIETIDGDPFQWSPEEGSDAIDWFIGIQSERSLVRYASLIHPSEYGGLEVPKQTSFNRSFVSHSLGSFISAIRELVLFATCFQCFYFSLLSLPAIKHAGALDAGIPARAACGVIPAHNVLVKPKRIRLTTDELWALSLLLSGLTDFDGSLLSLSSSAAFPPSEPLRVPPSPFQPLPAPPSPSEPLLAPPGLANSRVLMRWGSDLTFTSPLPRRAVDRTNRLWIQKAERLNLFCFVSSLCLSLLLIFLSFFFLWHPLASRASQQVLVMIISTDCYHFSEMLRLTSLLHRLGKAWLGESWHVASKVIFIAHDYVAPDD